MMAQDTVSIVAKPPIWFRPALWAMVKASNYGYRPTADRLERFSNFAAKRVRLYAVDGSGKEKRIRD